jgi:hypothetical protein
MDSVKVLPVTPQMRADALWRDYQRRPRMFRLTPGHLRYIARLEQHRLNGHGPGHNGGAQQAGT